MSTRSYVPSFSQTLDDAMIVLGEVVPARLVDSPASDTSSGSDSSSDFDALRHVHDKGKGHLQGCFNPSRQEIQLDRKTNAHALEDGKTLNLQAILDAVPSGSTLKSIVINGFITLTSIRFPTESSVLVTVKSLSIIDSALASSPTLFDDLAQAMPNLETLDLTGSFLTDLHGIDGLISHGLTKLYLKGGRIDDFGAIEEIAKQLHAGTWQGELSLSELDVRDNALPR